MNEHTHPPKDHPTEGIAPRVTDPVCGMKIDPAKAAGSVRHRGRLVHFCGKSCQAKFEADPDRYLPAKSQALTMAVAPVAAATELALDPVCGMRIDPAKAAGSTEYQGKTIYFCCQGCLRKFVADPGRYLAADGSVVPKPSPAEPNKAPAGASTAYICPMDPEVRSDRPGPCPKCGMALEPDAITPLATKTEYVCPMHPEVVRDAPGSCPKCGMALEPRTTTVDEPDNPELADMTRRFRVGLALTIPVFLLAMGDMLPGSPLQSLMSPEVQGWLELALSTPVVLWAGAPFFQQDVGVLREPKPQHVHSDRHRLGRRVFVQRGRDLVPAVLPRFVPRPPRSGGPLLRGGERHHRSRPPWSGPRTARAQPHRQRDSGAARSCARKPRVASRRTEPRPTCPSSR